MLIVMKNTRAVDKHRPGGMDFRIQLALPLPEPLPSRALWPLP